MYVQTSGKHRWQIVSGIWEQSFIHIVSATALIHRTARPSISVMSSLLGISPKCVQLVMIWFRSHVAAPHIQCLFSRKSHRSFCCRGGSLSRAHSVGRLPCTPRQCVTTRELFFWMDVIFLQVALGSLPLMLPLRDTSFCGLTQERLGG